MKTHLLMPTLRTASIAVFALMFSTARGEDIRPLTTPPEHPVGGAEIQRLREQMEAMRHRIEQLQRLHRPPPPEHPAGHAPDVSQLANEARRIMEEHDRETRSIWTRALATIKKLTREMTDTLQSHQDRYTMLAKLDEALAVRAAIAHLKEGGRKVLADPGSLRLYDGVARALYFRVTGSASGSVYGTDVYTLDSSLAIAAVHAGILQAGQTGVVKVTTIPSHPSFVGSLQNGIRSSPWGAYAGFHVEALGPEDMDMEEFAKIGEAPNPFKCAPPPGPQLQTAYTAPPANPPPGPEVPAEVRELIERHDSAVSDIRKDARAKVERVTAATVSRLTPIQDAHTRAARLDEALEVRCIIRKLTGDSDRP